MQIQNFSPNSPAFTPENATAAAIPSEPAKAAAAGSQETVVNTPEQETVNALLREIADKLLQTQKTLDIMPAGLKNEVRYILAQEASLFDLGAGLTNLLQGQKNIFNQLHKLAETLSDLAVFIAEAESLDGEESLAAPVKTLIPSSSDKAGEGILRQLLDFIGIRPPADAAKETPAGAAPAGDAPPSLKGTAGEPAAGALKGEIASAPDELPPDPAAARPAANESKPPDTTAARPPTDESKPPDTAAARPAASASEPPDTAAARPAANESKPPDTTAARLPADEGKPPDTTAARPATAQADSDILAQRVKEETLAENRTAGAQTDNRADRNGESSPAKEPEPPFAAPKDASAAKAASSGQPDGGRGSSLLLVRSEADFTGLLPELKQADVAGLYKNLTALVQNLAETVEQQQEPQLKTALESLLRNPETVSKEETASLHSIVARAVKSVFADKEDAAVLARVLNALADKDGDMPDKNTADLRAFGRLLKNSENLLYSRRQVEEWANSLRDMANDMIKSSDMQSGRSQRHIQSSFVFNLLPEGQDKRTPVHISIYHDKGETGGLAGVKTETWLRVNVSPEYVGQVTAIFHLYQENLLDVRVVFANPEGMKEFSRFSSSIKEALQNTAMRLNSLLIV